jgi:hypothetical protein
MLMVSSVVFELEQCLDVIFIYRLMAGKAKKLNSFRHEGTNFSRITVEEVFSDEYLALRWRDLV